MSIGAKAPFAKDNAGFTSRQVAKPEQIIIQVKGGKTGVKTCASGSGR